MSISLMAEYDTVEVITMTYRQIREYISLVIPSCYKTSELIEECPDTRARQETYPFFKCSLPINIVFSEALINGYHGRREQFDADGIIDCAVNGTDQEPISFLRQEINTVISPFSSNQIKLLSFPESDEVSPRGKIS
ncbi:hypothetical protein ACQKKK_10585 [Peribacillus sp. NPDC006672]|uniref:hypothetical protein n=1 Tax=Peribacillus sp. NPDC006672 TaxID=3390606 RepID=UPI003D06EE1C